MGANNKEQKCCVTLGNWKAIRGRCPSMDYIEVKCDSIMTRYETVSIKRFEINDKTNAIMMRCESAYPIAKFELNMEPPFSDSYENSKITML